MRLLLSRLPSRGNDFEIWRENDYTISVWFNKEFVATYVLDANGDKTVSTAVWDDLRFPSQGINAIGQAAPPSVDATVFPGTLLFSQTLINSVGGVAQMPHAWKDESEVHPHVHWAKTTSAVGVVLWEIRYTVSNIGAVFPAYSAWLPCSYTVSDSNTNSKHAIATFPAIVMTGLEESCIIMWELRRNATDAGDTYGADARLFELDFHYQKNKMGTILETPG